MHKRLFTLTIFFVFIFSCVGFTGCGRVAGAENEPEPDPEPVPQTYVVDGITVTASPENYFVFDGAGTITGLTAAGKSARALIIPETIGGVTVTAIGDGTNGVGTGLFNTTQRAIVFPDTVTTIRSYVINYSAYIAYVRLPANLTQLDTRAFDWSNQSTNPTIVRQGLSELAFPATLTTIPSGAVHGMGNLTTIILRVGTANIDGAFWESNSNMRVFTDYTSKPAGWINDAVLSSSAGRVIYGISADYLDEMAYRINRTAIAQAVLLQQTAEYDAEVARLGGIIDGLGDEIDRLGGVIEGLEGDISDLETARDGYRDHRDELLGDIDDLNDDIADLEKQIIALGEGHEDEKAELQSQITAKQSQITAKETEINGLNEQITALNGEITVCKAEKTAFETEIERLRDIEDEYYKLLLVGAPDPEIIEKIVVGKPNPVMMIVGSIIAVIGLGCLGGGATLFIISRKKK